ncbi:MAG: NTP transferase domain-containing protein, partial [Bacteroidota bacterium]
MKILGIIPARYASTRFPGKALFMIHGKSMIRRVYEQALKCAELDHVVVATDDDSIRKQVELYGGQVIMTSEKHRSGTERCLEVVEKLTSIENKWDIVINI